MKGELNGTVHYAIHTIYQDQGSLCKQSEQKKQDSTCVAEVQEVISEALVV